MSGRGGRIQARCRVCGVPVAFFGDVCAYHEPDEAEGLDELERADRHALEDRAAAEDY